MYASGIGLTFNRKPKFSTVPGGICSLLTAYMIIAYLVLKIIQLVYFDTQTQTDTISYNTHNGVNDTLLTSLEGKTKYFIPT